MSAGAPGAARDHRRGPPERPGNPALHPARLALGAFALVIAATTFLLHLPVSRADGHRASLVDSLFTATSAVCVTGLTTVDTATYWTTFGHVVIAVAIKLGGLGTLTLAAILVRTVSRRLGLQQRLIVAQETKAQHLGEVGSLLSVILLVSTSLELVIAAVLFPRFLQMHESLSTAAGHSAFYAVSAFNNAGFVIHPGGLPAGSESDWFLTLPIAVAVLVGSVGFPVQLEVLRRFRRPAPWSMHTQLTVWTTLALLAVSTVVIGALEWTRRDTLGGFALVDRPVAAFFTAVMPRSGGFSLVDPGHMQDPTRFFIDGMMFIGGGSSSTAGGIRVTTFAVIVAAAWAEGRGLQDVNIGRRRLSIGVVRLAVSVVLLAAVAVWAGTTTLLLLTDFRLDAVLFETISAFATCGLSTGITPDLPAAGKVVLCALMLFGRAGMLTLVAAIAVRERRRLYRYPEERPIVG
ncbi:MAG: TrkH family potassium uptake protein [Thermoleophilia bacterium]|nr:TrkH family potassium uptake protein [Thermoleophilia bacterium]